MVKAIQFDLHMNTEVSRLHEEALTLFCRGPFLIYFILVQAIQGVRICSRMIT